MATISWMNWKCWRCASEHRYSGPLDPVDLNYLTCENCGAKTSVDPTEGASEYEQIAAGQLRMLGSNAR